MYVSVHACMHVNVAECAHMSPLAVPEFHRGSEPRENLKGTIPKTLRQALSITHFLSLL